MMLLLMLLLLMLMTMLMMMSSGSNKVNSFLNMAIEECTGKENCNKGFCILQIHNFAFWMNW